MDMMEKAALITRQMKKATVILSYKDDKMSVTMQGASKATYGYIISEFLSSIAEERPDMIPALCSACEIFMNSPEVTDYDE